MSSMTARFVFSAALAVVSVPALAGETPSDAPPPAVEDAALIEAIISDLDAVFDGVPLGEALAAFRPPCHPRVCCTEP